jgi:hypothetical protein
MIWTLEYPKNYSGVVIVVNKIPFIFQAKNGMIKT